MNYDERCVAAVQHTDGTVDRCSRPASGGDPMYLTLIPVCSWHFTKARRQFAEPLEDEVAHLKDAAAKHECDGDRAVQQYIEECADQQIGRTRRWKESSEVYFMRCGGYIKIGVSSSPLYRLNTIRKTGGVLAPYLLDLTGAELIATEPGGYEQESALHAKFAHLRHTGEWFTEAPELTEYIEALIERQAA